MSSGRQGSRSPQELFSRGKNGFFSSHKVCIVAQRGALMSARGPRGADNLGSVPQAPYACHSPEGAQTVPGCQAPAIPPQALGSEIVDKPRGSRHPGPRSQVRSRALGNQGCLLHPGSDLDSKCSRETA